MASRRSFSIKQKLDIISRLQNGESNTAISKEFKVSHSTVSTMWKNRFKIMERFRSKSLLEKRHRLPNYPDVESALLAWFRDQGSDTVPNISIPMLQEKANHFGRLLGRPDFKCSKTWIYQFRLRHKLGQECKEKWKNLRAVQTRHMRPENNMKPYYLSDAMKFTLPFIKNAKPKEGETSKIKTEINEEIGSENEQQSAALNDRISGSLSSPSSPQPPASPHSTAPSSPHSSSMTSSCQLEHSKKRLRDEDEFHQYNEATWTSENIKMTSDTDLQQDPNKMFLLSLAPDMNQMSLSQIRKFKKKVIDLIDDILENTSGIDHGSNIPLIQTVETINTAFPSASQSSDITITTSSEYPFVKKEIPEQIQNKI